MPNILKIDSRGKMSEAAKAFAQSLNTRKPKSGATVIGLTGELGAGKTTFTQYLLRALGVKGPIISPTFLLIKEYPLKHSLFETAYHLDCYRLEKPQELFRLGLTEILENPKNIVLIEWADRLKKQLPKNTVWLQLSHGKKEGERYMRMQ